jgi:signal transduction histidine kinase/HAMP domain-containing protein
LSVELTAKLLRFSPYRLALLYVVLSGLVLGLFAVPLWYVWRQNYSTLRTYVDAQVMQEMLDRFSREGPSGLAAAIDARLRASPGNEVILLADPSKARIAGNVGAWPSTAPEAGGTSGLVADVGGRSLRVVVTHVRLPGGYHFLMGRESARFQSLVDLYWYGIAGAVGIVLVLGAVVGWMIRRALLSEVHEISRTASAIADGDFSRRVAVGGGAGELDALARTVNGMLEQLAGKNAALEGEIAVRRQAEHALHRAHDDLERLIVQRTAQLKRANDLLSAEKQTLEIIASGASLTDILDNLCRCIDAQAPGAMTTILLMDPDGQRLWPAAGPRVPPGWTQAITPLPIGPSVGSCGTAAFRREPVVTSDIAIDPLWTGYRDAALRHGLRASWSQPLMSKDHRVVGTFAMYFAEPRSPSDGDVELIRGASDVALIAIERKRAEEALQKAQTELAHVTRLATLGELTASIAHEINQPLGAIVNNAGACLRWLAADNLEEVRSSAALVIADGHRASEIIRRIRALATNAPPRRDWLDLNDTVRDVAALAQSELSRHGVALDTWLADDVPSIVADRIQVQQVILNLVVNAIEAMSGRGDGRRELSIRSALDDARYVTVAVRDSGPGLDAKSVDRVFDAFYTTKPQGLGMGLAICRSIVEAHGGRLWATPNDSRGATFQFTLPIAGAAGT